jgi:hypothetical protein
MDSPRWLIVFCYRILIVQPLAVHFPLRSSYFLSFQSSYCLQYFFNQKLSFNIPPFFTQIQKHILVSPIWNLNGQSSYRRADFTGVEKKKNLVTLRCFRGFVIILTPKWDHRVLACTSAILLRFKGTARPLGRESQVRILTHQITSRYSVNQCTKSLLVTV